MSGMQGGLASFISADTNQRGSQLRTCLHRLACRQVCWAFSWLMIDGGWPSPLWWPCSWLMVLACMGKQSTRSKSVSSTRPRPGFSSRTWALALTSFDNHCGVEMSTKQPHPELAKVFHHSWTQTEDWWPKHNSVTTQGKKHELGHNDWEL